MNDTPSLRDRAIDAVKQAINAGGYWLPPAGQTAAVDAVLALAGAELDASQRRAVRIQQLLDDTRDRMRKLAAELSTGTHWDGNEPEIGERIIAALHQPRETPDA